MAQSKEDYIKDKGDKGDDVSFTLVNEDAVKRLKEDGVIKVPEKKINVPKDMRWNEKQMASKILQGIQNGDSVNKISKSLESVVDNNRVSAMRNARTMTTAAENRGRFDSYRKLDEKGVVQKKVWIATPDDRVRASHLDIDGEEQEINAPFSNGCQFPADGNGPAEEVWNCRCSMKDYIVGFRRKDGTVSYVEGGPDKTMHSEQIAKQKEIRNKKQRAEDKIIESGIKEAKKEEVKIGDTIYTRDEIMEIAEYEQFALPEILLDGYSEEEIAKLLDENGNFDKEKLDKFLFSKEEKAIDKLLPIIDNNPPTKEGIDLYASFINASDWNPTYDLSDIHSFAGYNPYNYGDYDPNKADLEKLKQLDTVFTPAPDNITRYKGSYMTDETIKELNNQKSLVHSYSSTTIDKSVMKDYADRAYDFEEVEMHPIYETLHIEKGVPIADTREILGEGGMRTWEKETTIGRETEWEYSNFKKHTDEYGEVYYTVDVNIKRRK